MIISKYVECTGGSDKQWVILCGWLYEPDTVIIEDSTHHIKKN